MPPSGASPGGHHPGQGAQLVRLAAKHIRIAIPAACYHLEVAIKGSNQAGTEYLPKLAGDMERWRQGSERARAMTSAQMPKPRVLSI